MFLHVMSSTSLCMGLEGKSGYEAMCITAACIILLWWYLSSTHTPQYKCSVHMASLLRMHNYIKSLYGSYKVPVAW